MRWLSPPDIVPEFETLAYLLEDAARDLVLFGAEAFWQVGEPLAGAPDRHLGDLADMQAADLHAQRLGLQAEAVAGRAGNIGEIFRDLLTRPLALGLAPAALQIRDHALERF